MNCFYTFATFKEPKTRTKFKDTNTRPILDIMYMYNTQTDVKTDERQKPQKRGRETDTVIDRRREINKNRYREQVTQRQRHTHR